MMKPLISVIVPIYKVEEYLNRCVESLVNQTYKNLEIILVDDGSPDNCPEMCDRWAKQDKRIRVIHKTNGGLSDARNAGMRIATGEYIAFVDSDDWIDIETYSLVIQQLLMCDAQIGAFNIAEVTEEDADRDLSTLVDIMSPEQAIEDTIDNIGVRTVAWNKVYHKDILRGLFFPKGKLHEDEFFTFYALAKAETIVYLHRQCYYYFQRAESIMNTYNPNHIDALEGIQERLFFVKKYYPEIYVKAKIALSKSCIVQYKSLLQYGVEDKSYQRKVETIRNSFKVHLTEIKGLRIDTAAIQLISNSKLGLRVVSRIISKKNH